MQADDHAFRRWCQMMAVSRSEYYTWQKRVPSPWDQEDEKLNTIVQAVHTFIQDRYNASRYTVKNELTNVETKHFDD
jgi:hypothetical protein